MTTALVAVAGLTPQVVTETLQALFDRGEVPGEIHVLTTWPGRQKVRELLLDPQKGAFYAFCDEYGIDHRAIRFDLSTVHALFGPEGRPIEDLRTVEENAELARQILTFVRALADRPEAAIHASLAGGRKTMSFYLGQALMFCGRAQDRLSHVLVSEDFETHPEFFYVPRKPVELRTRGGKTISTADAKIDLIDIPFLRLRGVVPGPALEEGFEELTRRAQAALAACREAPEVAIGLADKTVACGGLVCRGLTDQQLALYVHFLLAHHALSDTEDPEAHFRSFHDLTGEGLMEELWGPVGRALGLGRAGSFHRLQELVEKFPESPKGSTNFRSAVSALNKVLAGAFPPPLADLVQIHAVGRAPARYGVRLPRGRVRFTTAPP
ncbi:MAG: CRISPR-associated ring nuclease Csm6 [Thermodesulfobacteriota bacterium]